MLQKFPICNLPSLPSFCSPDFQTVEGQVTTSKKLSVLQNNLINLCIRMCIPDSTPKGNLWSSDGAIPSELSQRSNNMVLGFSNPSFSNCLLWNGPFWIFSATLVFCLWSHTLIVCVVSGLQWWGAWYPSHCTCGKTGCRKESRFSQKVGSMTQTFLKFFEFFFFITTNI